MWNSSLPPQWFQGFLIRLARTSELSGRRPFEIRMFLDKSSNPAQSFIATRLQLVAWQRNPPIDHHHLEFSETEKTLLYHPHRIAPLEIKKKNLLFKLNHSPSSASLLPPLAGFYLCCSFLLLHSKLVLFPAITWKQRGTLMDSFFFFKTNVLLSSCKSNHYYSAK